MAWRKLIGENWDVDKLSSIMPEQQWMQFVAQNEKLIYRAMLDYGSSRVDLGQIIESYI